MAFSNVLMEVINDISNKVVKKKMKGVPKSWVGQVIETSGSVGQNGIAQVYLNGDTNSTPISVKSKSNETLVANDEVYLFSPSGSLNNCVILYKK